METSDQVVKQLIVDFLQVSNGIYANERKMLNHHGLKTMTLTEMRLIGIISRLEKPIMSDLAFELNITLGTLTTLINQTVKKGYVTRIRDRFDKRFVRAVLTEKGEKAVEIYYSYYENILKEAMKEFTEQDVATLNRIIAFLDEYNENFEIDEEN